VDRDVDNSGVGMREILERRIDQAMGRMAADLVVRNARILDLATSAIHSVISRSAVR
jgi:adenine deaminase